MKILDWKIEDFGRHRVQAAETDTGVVGLLGENGSGKSTLLSALKFAFTGRLDEAHDTYIRNHGAEGGAESAKIKVRFSKGGREGTIFRQIGKGTKRWMKWDGKRITKSKDIESKLEEILGVDRKAIDTAVFIPQGELNQMLFGPPSDREALFTRLLCLGYLDKVSTQAGEASARLGSEIEDHTARKEVLEQQRRDAEEHLANAEASLSQNPDVSLEHAMVSGYLEMGDRANTLEAEAKKQGSMASSMQSALGAIQFPAPPEGVGEAPHVSQGPQEHLDRVVEIRKDQGALLADLQARRARYLAYEAAEAGLRAAREEVDRCGALLAEMSGPGGEDPDTLSAAIDAADRRWSEVQRLASLEESLKARKGERDQVMKDLQAHPLDESAEVRIEEMQADLTREDQRIELVKQVRSMVGSGEEVSCPCCGSEVDPVRFSSEALESMEEGRSDMAQALSEMREAEQASSARRASLGARLSTAIHDIAGFTSEISELRDTMAAAPLADARPVEDLRRLLQEAQVEAQRRSDASRRMDQAQESLEAHEASSRDLVREEDPPPEDISNALKQVIETDAYLDLITPLVRKHSTVLTSIASAQSSERRLREEVDGVYKEMGEASASWSKEMLDGVSKGPDTYVDSLSRAMMLRSELAGKVESARESANAVREQQKDLEARIAHTAKKQAVVEELKQLRTAFSRSGIPRAVINHRFAQLVDLVQGHLEATGANFTVLEDLDTPVTFRFVRLDDASGYQMNQSKLSGGQRVRLSVAFLMAVQQLLVPELGLLVLDEPSMHLDDEGVQSLAHLLSEMGSGLSSQDAQVIVCDHDPTLQPAFGITVHM